ncbi:UvrD-helicase domain-containing protein [Streptomyces sp. SID11385]|uniref:UvrD-helicase domain-containing protein n=1 Tax=Streptomyces sp. SID11385 TaxID=2706031 RepID=UPI0013C7CA60|nr:UvrD-helicase domain-containing protein [Streptomyces sp. SID11385]
MLTAPAQLAQLLGIPFTPEQLACITAPPAPHVIVAGAGSGKTTVMAARVVWLVGTGAVAPEQVLGLTFTNKAAAELAERVRRSLVRAGISDPDAPPAPGADPPGEPLISTYHSFAGRLLDDHGLRLGLEPGARLLADASRFQLAARVLREAPGPYPALTRGFSDLVSDLLALDSELSEHLVDPADLSRYDEDLLRTLAGARLSNDALRKVPEAAAARLALTELTGRYRAAKRARDLIDFGDQLALSARLAREHPEVGEALRAQYRVVLLDEYQDTSVAQRVLLSALFGGGTGHPVTAVGDPCQAIYGWRGASVANLDDFPRHFPLPDGAPARRQSLSENRRSGGRLLTLANDLAAPLRALHDGVEALHAPAEKAADGYVRCALLPTHAEEIDWLADSVAHYVRTGTSPGEIAVLCRTAGDFARIQSALVAREIPVEVVGLSGLLHLPEIADLRAVCEVLQDPGANASLVRLLTGPRWRVGARDLALLGRRARLLAGGRTGEDDPERRLAAAVEGVDPAEIVSLADAVDTFVEGGPDAEDGLPFSAASRARFARLGRELRELRRALADPLMDVLHRVLAVTGLDVELSASPNALAARRRETLGQFLDTAAAFAANEPAASLLAFLGYLRTAEQYEKGLDNALPGGENTVKVLTAHKAKGLEWDVVAVPGLVKAQFPSDRGREKFTARASVLPHPLRGDAATLPDVPDWTAKGLKAFQDGMRAHQSTEELRLGYVTFTRPRSILLGSGHWWGPEQKRPRGPSAFLTALHDHCVRGHGEIEHWAEPPGPDDENPALRQTDPLPWPLPLDPEAHARRREAAARVEHHLALLQSRPATDLAEQPPEDPYDPEWPPEPEDEPEPEPGDGVPDPYEGATGPYEGATGPYEEAPGPYEETPDPYESDAAHRVPAPAAHGDALPPPGDDLTPEESRLLGSWDRDLDALEGELRRAAASVREVPLPPSLTATQVLRLAEDPDGLARDLARPLPQAPKPAARRGARFHAWLERRLTAGHEQPHLPLADEGDTEAREDAEISDDLDLEELKEAFERTAYAHRPAHRVEVPFQLSLAGRVVRGRIDAVYASDEDGRRRYEIVDWKTGRDRTRADPLQLAVYRLAWAERHGIDPEEIAATFVFVRTGEAVRPGRLPGRAELERLFAEEDPTGPAPAPPGPRAAHPSGG